MNAGPSIAPKQVGRHRPLLITALVTCLYLTASAAAATALVNPSSVASSVAGKPVTVVINSFGNGTWGSGAFVAGDQIFLGQDAYRAAEGGGGVGLFLLLHETGHATGIADEHTADCFALEHLKGVLVRFWHLRPQQVDERYRDALLWPGKYAGNGCPGAGQERDRASANAR
jgi:hypothetical protein